MKRKLKKCMAVSIAMFVMVAMLSHFSAFAAKTIIYDDFESDTVGENISTKSYWSQLNNAITGGNDENKYATIAKDANGTGMLLRDYPSNPAGRQFVSTFDFYIPEGSEEAQIVLQSTWAAGKGHATKGVMDSMVIYDTDQHRNSPMTEELETGRWYNLLVTTDLDTDSYTVYFGENASTLDFIHSYADIAGNPNTQNYAGFRRIFYLTENRGYPINIDNAGFFTQDYPALDTAVFRARNLVVNATEGYENGKYSKGSIDMLNDVYNRLYPIIASTNPLNEETVAEYTTEINAAITNFISSKIDISSTSSDAAFVKVSDSMPVAAVVDPTAGYTLDLDADACTVACVETADEVVWSLENTLEGVSVEGNTLTALPNCGGVAVLKATAGNFYTYHSIDLTPVRTVEISDVAAADGTIEISGVLSGKATGDVLISVASSELGINLNDTISINEDNTFTWVGTVPPATSWGILQIAITGSGIFTANTSETYYGVGWETGILESFNNTSNTVDDIGALLSASGRMLELDAAHYALNSSTYNERIKTAAPYENINAVKKTLDEVKYIIDQSNSSRSNIESLISGNILLLVNNGFDIDKFTSLTGTVLTEFYVNAARIDVDVLTTTIADIAGDMNIAMNILTDDGDASGGVIETPPTTYYPSTSGGGGGGGGYMVKPVTVTPVDAEEKDEPSQPPVDAFADVSADHWAAEALNYMKSKGVMVGDGSGNALPSNSLTRGEAAKIIVLAFELAGTDNRSVFADAQGKWWETYAKIASDCNIVNGISENTFGGDMKITREMLAVMVARVLKAKQIELYDQNDGVTFSDEEHISEYAKEAVAFLAKKGIVSGIGANIFAPNAAVTRAEMAQITYNILKQQ